MAYPLDDTELGCKAKDCASVVKGALSTSVAALV